MDPNKAKILQKIKNADWDIQNFNGLPLYLICAAGPTGWMLKKAVGVNYRHFFFQFSGDRAEMFYDKADLKRIGGAYYKKIKNKKQLARLERLYNLAYKKTINEISKPINLKKNSDEKLITLAQKARESLIFSVGLGHVVESVSYVSETKLKRILAGKDRFTHEHMQLLCSPVNPSFLSEVQNLLWKTKHLKGQAQKAALKKFAAEYSWIENNYIRGRVIGKREILRKAQIQKSPVGLKFFTNIKNQKAALIKKLKLTAKQRFVVETVEFCSIWQDKRKARILQSIGRFEPITRELARRLGLKPEQLKFAVPQELDKEHLLNPRFLAVLKKRYPSCAYYITPQQTRIFAGKDLAIFKKIPKKQSTLEIRELRGTVANRGIASGLIKICHGDKDIKSFKPAQILVATMTRPEYLPAMQKAAAIVTDEGGITSHAAIVSRELGVPCVIGTKIATKVLKDGDAVEVDANKGIVTRL